METPQAQELIAALRHRTEPAGHDTELSLDPAASLARSVEKILFDRGELGPVDAIVARGSATLDAAED